jgi:5-formyltetrahydrofolate cyclo-ligase
MVLKKDFGMDKTQLRLKLKNCLSAITQEQRDQKSKNACLNLIASDPFQKASTVMLYMSLPHEVNTDDAIFRAWQLGKTVVVPKVYWDKKHMVPVQINSLEMGFASSVGGLKNPVCSVPVPYEEIDLVVTPGLGFDRNGNRLGRGGCYYDRFFADPLLKAVRCGFAFKEQLVDEIPMEPHDQKMDIIITDDEVIYCRNRQGE